MAVRQIARDSYSGSGELTLMQSRINDHKFRVDLLVVKVTVYLDNATAGALALKEFTYGHAWRFSMKYRDGTPFSDDISWKAAEGNAHLHFNGALPDPRELVRSGTVLADTATGAAYAAVTDVVRSYQNEVRTRIVALSANEEVHTFFLVIPLALPMAKKPEDFSQALSLLGEMKIKVTNDTGTANITLGATKWIVEVMALGENVNHFHAGTRRVVKMQSGQLPKTVEEFSLSGRLLTQLAYTKDNSASPIAPTDPRIKIDDTQTLVDLADLDAQDLRYVLDTQSGIYPARSEIARTDMVAFVVPPRRWSIFDRPKGSLLRNVYASNPGTAGDQFYVWDEAVAKKHACRKVLYPGADKLTPDQLLAVTEISKAEPGALPEDARDWLAEKVYTPEVTGSCGL